VTAPDHYLPDHFVRHIGQLMGADGRRWLARLPDLIAEVAERWALTVDPPFPNLTYSFVAPATRADSTRTVLNIGFPHVGILTEIHALNMFGGNGAVRLLESDLDRYISLLECLEPGTSLLQMADDEKATSIAASTMSRLWRPPPKDHPFPTVERWSRDLFSIRDRFQGTTGPFPGWIIDRAQSLTRELIASMDEPVVLHGDLHQDNILSAQREPWLAIDPKGIVGEPCYDTGSWLRNWLPDLLEEPNPPAILARRISQFAEQLGFDRERIRGWAFAQAVLSECWSSEEDDYSGPMWALQCAELLASVKP
jgi:streptomycin 6-kinase